MSDALRLVRSATLAILLLGALAPTGWSQDDAGYRRPPEAIAKIIEAPPLPSVSTDPSGRWMLLIERDSLPPISDLAQPMWRLAGYRINPRTSGPHGARGGIGLQVQAIEGGERRTISLPANANIGSLSWSPDSSRFAFTNTADDAIELWVGDPESAKAQRMGVGPLSAVLGRPFTWMPDSRHLLVTLIPEDRGPRPERPIAPSGPVIRETIGGTAAPVRTYQDLLQDEHDETIFEWVATSQLALIDTQSGQKTMLGVPAIYSEIDPSPNGEYLLVTRIVRPFSQLVTARSFPDVTEVWSRSGDVVRTLFVRPLQDTVPIGGVTTSPRSVGWRPTAPSTLVYAEALDGGDPKAEVPHRDRILTLKPPFDEPQELLKTEHRYWGTSWLQDGHRGLLTEYDRDRRWIRTWVIDADADSLSPKLVWDRSRQDRYGDPGRPITTRNAAGQSVVLVHEGAIFLSGRGASPEGDRPFLDKMSLADLKTERLWQNSGESYESVDELISPEGPTILTSYETPKTPPNYFLQNLAKDTRRALTHFEDPAPELADVHKELITYEREDGVQLSATLYLPASYEEGQRLPLVVWAYPREYNDPAIASQVSGSPYRFTRPSGISHLFFLLQGYAILDGAAMPVVGPPESANDTFVEQIVSSAKAAIDKAAEMGVADARRVGVGGHSYGAFMTANLLAHSDLFRAGIARSGAYNRTLTPFGFQNEERTLWQAPEIYFAMSPFMHADDINEPLLMIHGQLDNNSGTFPMQSERLYHGIKGHGGKVRLVMLPHESHGYRAKESVLHTLAEMVEWFDIYVKNADITDG
ncbi:MAG: prolyl oligopeptidase family serine peptidase [Planctomycetota bacterium]